MCHPNKCVCSYCFDYRQIFFYDQSYSSYIYIFFPWTVFSLVFFFFFFFTKQVFSLIASGESHRHVGSTNFNHRSSRSHTIFRFVIESRGRESSKSEVAGGGKEGSPNRDVGGRGGRGGAAALVSTLSLVDLAGSECATGTTKRSKKRRSEGGYINKSLLTLSHIILKLSDAAKDRKVSGGGSGELHLPYRDSKLTRILKPALDGK